MPKFRVRKPSIVDAEQFVVVDKDNPQSYKAVRGMTLWSDGKVQPGDMSLGYVTNRDGIQEHVWVGNWVVADTDGEYFYRLNASEFARDYEPLAEDGWRADEYKFSITDSDGSGRQRELVVMHETLGITIGCVGYGLQEMETGYQQVIFIEIFDGGLRMFFWPDINSPKSERVDLDGAREEFRKDVE